MVIPDLLPTPKPFQEAIAWQLQRTPQLRAQFDELDPQLRLRSWTMAAAVRQSVVEEAWTNATRAIADGKTKEEHLEQLGKLADREGFFLSPERLDLIDHNNSAVALASGRYQQMLDPDITSQRPFWQYALGPHDTSTSAICIALEGFVARFDDPAWQQIYPPNHHKERHIQVTTLTAEQAEATGKIYTSPEGAKYPMLDGRTILPDPGWDGAPGLLSSDSAWLAERAAAVGDVIAMKTPASYGIGELGGADEMHVYDMPRRLDAKNYADFRKLVGGVAGSEDTILLDPNRDGVRINEASYEALTGSFAGLIPMTIADPFEMWWVRRASGFTRRYLRLVDAGDEVRVHVLEVSREGWLFDGGVFDLDQVEELRGGLLLFSKLLKGVN